MAKKLDAKVIGARLRELRGNRRRADVCKAVGISVSALTMYEIGERIPRDEIKIKLAEYYNRSLKNIFFTNE